MSDTGTITEIEPEDGLGWIELENGERVRFGGTSCKGFVPSIGMTVKVVASRPGYGGTVKATELARVADAPRTFATKGGQAGAPVPRTNLHTLQSAHARADELLQTLIARADVEDGLYSSLKSAFFEIDCAPGLEHGCRNPWFYRVAKDGQDNAYGLYVHPMFDDGQTAAPWVFWKKDGSLRVLAYDSAEALAVVLANAASWGAPADLLGRLRGVLVKMGMTEVDMQAYEGDAAPWLPPDDSALRPLDEYLGESDGAEMERGLLAHAYREGGDPRAAEALRSLYDAWGWSLPSWA